MPYPWRSAKANVSHLNAFAPDATFVAMGCHRHGALYGNTCSSVLASRRQKDTWRPSVENRGGKGDAADGRQRRAEGREPS